MAYSRKDVTNSTKKKHKSFEDTNDLMDQIDKAFGDMDQEKEEFEDTNDGMDVSFRDEIEGKKKDVEEDIPEEINEEETEDEIIIKEDPKEEEKDEEKHHGDTEIIDTEIMGKIEEEFEEDLRSFKNDKPTKEKKPEKNDKTSLFLIIVACISIFFAVYSFTYIIIDGDSSIQQIISYAILSLFALIYLVVCVTSKRKNEIPMFVSAFLLIAFMIFNIYSPNDADTISTNKMMNLSGKNLSEVVKWANKNEIKVTQEYEYSDMVPEYEVISQSVKAGTDIRDIDEIVVAISEGPNPYKEIIVPSMLTWDSERVINFVLNNHLSNVIVEFVESDQVKDTVIEQSKSGNLMRNEELRLVFSYGDEGNTNDVNLIDFTNKTKFEIEFYMKQNKLNYDFVEDFSDSIKKGYGVSQSIEAGSVVQVNGDKIQVTISKGPKITIPDLSLKTVEEITEWAIKNHLKLEFVDKYDDTVKKGKVVSVDKQEGDVVEQGTLVKVTLSLGGLKMPKFKSADQFYTWADKYGIKYETSHEFNSDVAAGEIIKFSHKAGQVLKNDDVITVTISDGKKIEVPNLKGLTKSEATKKLNNAGLKYNFVYKNSTSKKDTVLSQSISAGSEVSKGSTVTVTLSNGKTDGGGSNTTPSPKPSSNPSPSPSPSTPPTPQCNSCSVLGSGIKQTVINSVNNDAGYTGTANAVIAYIEGECAGIDVQVRKVTGTGKKAGTFLPEDNNGNKSWNGGSTTSCSTVHIYLAG